MSENRCDDRDQLSDDLANLDEVIADRDQRIAALEAKNAKLREIVQGIVNRWACDHEVCYIGGRVEQMYIYYDTIKQMTEALADTEGGA